MPTHQESVDETVAAMSVLTAVMRYGHPTIATEARRIIDGRRTDRAAEWLKYRIAEPSTREAINATIETGYADLQRTEPGNVPNFERHVQTLNNAGGYKGLRSSVGLQYSAAEASAAVRVLNVVSSFAGGDIKFADHAVSLAYSGDEHAAVELDAQLADSAWNEKFHGALERAFEYLSTEDLSSAEILLDDVDMLRDKFELVREPSTFEQEAVLMVDTQTEAIAQQAQFKKDLEAGLDALQPEQAPSPQLPGASREVRGAASRILAVARGHTVELGDSLAVAAIDDCRNFPEYQGKPEEALVNVVAALADTDASVEKALDAAYAKAGPAERHALADAAAQVQRDSRFADLGKSVTAAAELVAGPVAAAKITAPPGHGGASL